MKINFKKEAIENSFWDFIAKIIEKIGALVFTIILARFLLPEGFGLYGLTLAIALIFIYSTNYATSETLIRYVSYALGKNNKKLAYSYFKYILKIKIFLSLFLSVLLLFLAYPLSILIFKKPSLFLPLFISGFYIFVLAIENFYESFFYILKKVKYRTIKEAISQVSRVFITLTIFFLIAKSYYVAGIIFGLILTGVIVLIFLFFYVRKFSFLMFEKGEGRIDKKRILKFMTYLFFGGISGVLFAYVDVLMLGVFLPDVAYLGFYNASVALSFGIAGLLSFSSVFLPIFTQVKKKKIKEFFNKVMKYSFMVSVPMAFGIAVLSKYIVLIIYGQAYAPSAFVLSIMIFLLIESVNGSFIASLFSAKEKPKFVTKITLFILILNIVLNFILITLLLNISQLWALIGAAISTVISRYVGLISLIIIMRKKLKIKLKKASWIKPLVASFVMFIILFLLNSFVIKNMNLFLMVAEIILGGAIYFAFMLIIKGISKEDISNFNLFKL